MNKKRLVFDVEFAAENWEDFDEITQKDLMKRVPDKKTDPKRPNEASARQKV